MDKGSRRLCTQVAVAALAAGGFAPAGQAAAPRVRDGTPTPQACAAFGYSLAGQEDGAGGRGRRGALSPRIGSAPRNSAPAPAMQIPSARPPPAPPPPASVLAESVVVTGSRAPAMPSRYAPFPQAQDNERYPHSQTNAVKRVAEAPVSTFSIDVDTAAYANVRRFLNDGTAPPRDAVRVEELVNYFDYGYPRPETRAEPFRTFVAVAPSPWSPGKQIIHLGVQGYDLTGVEQPPLNLTFLVDVSGSMDSEDRLPLAKRSLNLLIDRLRPQDRVAMVVYAGAAGAVLEPTRGTEKLKMRCAIEALSAGGSTAGGQGLALAYAMARRNVRPGQVDRVILMTDGDFNVGVTDNAKLEDFVASQRKSGVYLSVYGFGRGNYQDARMQTLSQAGNGTAAYVDSLREARRLFAQDFSRQTFPIADDVKIQVEFNPARVSEYRLIGYETRLLNREDFNNDQVDAGEVGAGASVTALYEITPVGGKGTVDPLRYQSEPRAAAGRGGEIALVRLRYKTPGGTRSRLIERPITDRDASPSVAALPKQSRWALAVAAYGQKLRGDPWMGADYGWNRIAALASGAKGADPIGVRAEFIDLVGKAANGRQVVGAR